MNKERRRMMNDNERIKKRQGNLNKKRLPKNDQRKREQLGIESKAKEDKRRLLRNRVK